jgi:hypothetical protein
MLIIEELKVALEAKLYAMALNTALIVPDICGALESEDGRASGQKYKAWFDKYLGIEYSGIVKVTGDDIYKLRCASLHQGRFNHNLASYDKILFQIPDERNITLHRGKIGNSLVLSVEIFCNEIIAGYEEWFDENKGNDIIRANMENGIHFYPTYFSSLFESGLSFLG